jgi:hypothetical protein
VTSGRRRATFSARTLAIALACTRDEPIAATADTRQLPIPHGAARGAAHTLGLDRRRRDLEHLSALGASTAHGPACAARQVWPQVDHDPAAAPTPITRRSGSRSRREVDPC